MISKRVNQLVVAITLATASTVSFGMSTFGAHPSMTEDAAKYFIWTPEALQLLKAGAVYPDREHNTTAHNKEYFPELHFDRYQNESNHDAFLNGVTAYKKNFAKSIEMAKNGDLVGVFTHLGGALHAVQDFASHSNYIELPEKEQKIIDEILFGDRSPKELPKSVKLTHYDPDMPIPGIPEGSDYPHDIKSKDYPFRGDVSMSQFGPDEIGYQAAFDTGTYFAKIVLTRFMHALDEKSYRQVTNAEVWNVFPPYPRNCTVGDINKTSYTAMRGDNVVCEGKPDYIYKLETARKVGINTFNK